MLVVRPHVIPSGLRLYVTQEPCAALRVPCRTTPAVAAQLLRELKAPAAVNVVVLFDADDLCRVVGRACRDPHFHFASTRKSHRSLCTQGWKLQAGRDGRHLCRRRRTATLVMAKPHGRTRSRFVDAGWIEVSPLGPRHVVFSRKGSAPQRLGLVTEAPALAAAHAIRTYEKRWPIEPWAKDLKPLLGLGHDQPRPYRAAVIHRHLVGVAEALLTHRRLERQGAQSQRTREKAADRSLAAAQDQLRGLLWEALIAYPQEKRHGPSVIEALARLCRA